MSRHLAPQTQPIETNHHVASNWHLLCPLAQGKASPFNQLLPCPSAPDPVATHVSSCLPAVSTCMSNGHLQRAYPNWTPHPQAAPPCLPSSASGSLILPASQSKPLEHPWALSLPPPHTPHPSTVPLSSASGTHLDGTEIFMVTWQDVLDRVQNNPGEEGRSKADPQAGVGWA